MNRKTQERRLTTILAADVVGFSRLMGADESGTFGPQSPIAKSLSSRSPGSMAAAPSS